MVLINIKRSLVLVLVLVPLVFGEDRKYQLMGKFQNTDQPLKEIACSAPVGTDLECSLECGKEDDCGAFYVVQNLTVSKNGVCVLIARDGGSNYKNETSS